MYLQHSDAYLFQEDTTGSLACEASFLFAEMPDASARQGTANKHVARCQRGPDSVSGG